MAQTNTDVSAQTNQTFVPQKLTYEDFLREYDGQYAEYVNSEVIKPMSVTKKHNELTHFLSSIFQFYAEARRLGKIYGEPYQMRMLLGDDIKGREPDVFFVKTENLDRVREQFFDGAADLVIEVVSPESVARDTQDKFEEYEAAGVAEYWIIDYNRRTANFYGFDAKGKYQMLPLDGENRFASCVVEGLWIKTDWLWRENLPELLEVLKDWKLV